MVNRLSLKYRIAAAILILQTALMGLLLWRTISVSREISNDQLALREQTFLTVIGDISRITLMTGEYAELQQYISKLRQDPQIVHMFLADHRNRIVVSTRPYEIGRDIFPLENKVYLFWRTLEISNNAGKLGVLAMQFSHVKLNEAYLKTLKQSIGIASIGIAVFAVIGVFMGSLLTKRLGTLTKAAESFAKGNLNTRVDMPGNDEVSVLSKAFNNMADNINSSITDLKNSEWTIRESSIKFMAVFENSVDAIGVSSRGIQLFFNPAYLQLFGYSRPEELTGRPILDLIAPDQRPLISDRIQRRASDKNVPTFYETRGIRKDGSEFDMEVHVATYILKSAFYTLAILRDITERKRIEQALKKSEEKYRNLVDNAPIGIYKTNLKGDILFANQALLKIFEFDSLEEFVAGNVSKFYKNPTDREVFIKKLKETGKVDNYYLDIVTQKGLTKNILLTAKLSGDEIAGMILEK